MFSQITSLVNASGHQTLPEMIAACNFQTTCPDVNVRNFPFVGPISDGSRMLKITRKDLGGKNKTSAEIRHAIDQEGYRRATISELLAYALTTGIGKGGRLLAQGSSWEYPTGFRNYPMIIDGIGRRLRLAWDNPKHRWCSDYSYLIVLKEQQGSLSLAA